MSFAILGLGTALPVNSIDQAEAAEVAHYITGRNGDAEQLLPVLYRKTAIRTRHMVFQLWFVRDVLKGREPSDAGLDAAFMPTGQPDDSGPTTAQRMERYAVEAPPLAARAAGRALEQAGLPPAAMTHLVTVSCTGFSAPGLDAYLVDELGLPATVECTHVGFMGCHGAFNGLRIAGAFTRADPEARVLLCAVELCSLHYFYGWEPKRMVSNALFADGAAAVVGMTADHGPQEAWRLAANGSCFFPGSGSAMTWNIGDHGFEMSLSSRVPRLIEANLRPWLEHWLTGQGVELRNVASWAIHPGGPRILNAVEKSLGLSEHHTAASRELLADCGNMSSPTVLFILDRLRICGAPRPCVALGFGPGLRAEAALFQ